MAIAIALGGYILFEITLGVIASAEDRETEWLKRVGTPARLELGQTEGGVGILTMVEAVRAMKPGSDITVMFYIDRDGAVAWRAPVSLVNNSMIQSCNR